MSQRQFSQEIRLDPNVFLAFYDYVQKQHCHEALHFFLASEEYAGLPHPHRAKAEAALFAEYLVERAPEKINIADPIMKRIMQKKGFGLSQIYQEAHDSCVEILTGDAWPYFKDEQLEKVLKEKPVKDLKKAFTKVMRPEIAKHALYLFTGKHEDKLDTKKIGNEKLFEEWLNDGETASKAEVIAAMINSDPDTLFIRDIMEQFSATPDFIIEIFRRVAAVELKDFATDNDEHLISKFRDDSVVFEFFDEFFHFFASDWCKSFLEPHVRSYYALSLENKDQDEVRAKVAELATTFIKELLANPPPSTALKPIKELTDLLQTKFTGDRLKDIISRASARFLMTVLTKAMAFPNSWLEDRIRVNIIPRQYVAIIEELIHASYLPDKARRYIVAPASLVKKMKEQHSDSIIAFIKDTVKKPVEVKTPKIKKSKDTKGRISTMSQYAYASRSLLPDTLPLGDKLRQFFDMEVVPAESTKGKEKSKKQEESILQDDKGVRLVLLVGFSGVGRTAILNRMVDDSFGKTFYSKNDEVSSVFKFSGISVQIVNPALDEKTPFDDLPYLDRASGCLIVFDLTDFASFTDLAYWWEVAQKRYLPTVLLGNHLDECPNKREVNYDKTLKWAEDHGVKYYEVSAKSGENLQRAMESLVEGITLFKK